MELMTSTYCLPSTENWKVDLIVTAAQMECLAKDELELKYSKENNMNHIIELPYNPYQGPVYDTLDILTVQEDITEYELPEGGFVMNDSHMLVYVSEYPEDQIMVDVYTEHPDFDDYYDELLLPTEGIESSLDNEEF